MLFLGLSFSHATYCPFHMLWRGREVGEEVGGRGVCVCEVCEGGGGGGLSHNKHRIIFFSLCKNPLFYKISYKHELLTKT